MRTALPEELCSASHIAERTEAFLRDRAEDDTPFFLMVSWPDPHHPFNPPGRYWDMYDLDDMPVPEAFTRNDWTPPPHVAGVQSTREAGYAELKCMNAIGCSARQAQEAQALNCGMITMIDDAAGRVRGALAASCRVGETVEIFTTDRGLLFKGAEQFEQITRVPFFWADPEGAHGARSARFGQIHDIGATVLERARIDAAWGMQGLDLLGRDERPAADPRYAHQKSMDGIGSPPNVHTIRDAHFRLSVFQDMHWGELYDLDVDPGGFTSFCGMTLDRRRPTRE